MVASSLLLILKYIIYIINYIIENKIGSSAVAVAVEEARIYKLSQVQILDKLTSMNVCISLTSN